MGFGAGGYFSKAVDIVVPSDPNIMEIGQSILGAPANTVPVALGLNTIGTTGLFWSGKIKIVTEVTGNIAGPRLYLNNDRVDANYASYSSATAPVPQLIVGNLVMGTPRFWAFDIFREHVTGKFVLSGLQLVLNALAASRIINIVWHNPSNDTEITDIEINDNGSANNFAAGTSLSVHGIRRTAFI